MSLGLEERMRRLEERRSEADSRWVVPLEVSIYCKAVERYQAVQEGKEPPPYTPGEIAELRRDDLEIVAGGGAVGAYRNSKGWQSAEARELLASWERDAHRRVELGKALPPERWHEVWGRDYEEGEEKS
jgi:hypothetical protein